MGTGGANERCGSSGSGTSGSRAGSNPRPSAGAGSRSDRLIMQQQLGLSALRLPRGLAELGASPLFSAAATAGQEAPPDAAKVAAVLQQARRQPATALDWGLLFQALTSGQLQGSQPAQLLAVLSWAANSAREQLEGAPAAGERPSGGRGAAAGAASASDVGNPRQRQALQNTLKLSLLFLCCLARGEGTAGREAQHPAPVGGKRGGKKGKGAGAGGDAAAEVLMQLRARRDALLAASSIEDALHDNRTLLPAVSDLRAAGRLVRGAAMHCLVHPLLPGAAGNDHSAKELAEACFQAAAGECCLGTFCWECSDGAAVAGRPRRPALAPVPACLPQVVLGIAVPPAACLPPTSPFAQASWLERLWAQKSGRRRRQRPRHCKTCWGWSRSPSSRRRRVLGRGIPTKVVGGQAFRYSPT